MSYPEFPGGAEPLTRRQALRGAAALASALPLVGLAAPAAGLSPVAAGGAEPAPGRQAVPVGRTPTRGDAAFEKRLAAARFQRDQRWPDQAANGDEVQLPPGFSRYSKGLPHDAMGKVVPAAFASLLLALKSGRAGDFERIPLGGRLKLANPQAALAWNLVGPDPGAIPCAPAPRFGSAEQALELAELYWQALARDVPFAEYESHPLIARAAEDLGGLGAAGASAAKLGRVTPRTLFRGASPGCLTGPYISQFLLQDLPFASFGKVEQKIRTAAAEHDYMTAWGDWLAIQNGATAGATVLDGQPRHLRNGRDLAEYVHRDFSYQAVLDACLMLIKMGAPANPGNPYRQSRTQEGFATFGPPHVLALLASVSQAALTGCWYQKWIIHRRLRPEEMGGRVESHVKDGRFCPVHPSLLDAAALAETLSRQSSALLTSSYPEGCPAHPSYPAGHAVITGAGTTVLKAFFDESFILPQPVEASADGLTLRPYSGPPLTAGGELDKLAANIAMGRNFAGIHWRTDMTAGIELGEEVAISMLREHQLVANEPFAGWSFHRVDGRSVTA